MDKPTNPEGTTKKQKAQRAETESLEEIMVKTQSIFNNKNPKLHFFEKSLFLGSSRAKKIKLRVKRKSVRNVELFGIGDKLSRDDTDELMRALSCQTFTRNLSVQCNHEYEVITDEALSQLSRSFGSLPRLQILTLSFHSAGGFRSGRVEEGSEEGTEDKAEYEALRHLSYGFRSLPPLKSLTLNFQYFEGDLTNEAFTYLSQGLRSLHPLINFTLDFAWCQGKLTDEAFTHLSQGFRSHFSSLQSFTLIFPMSDEDCSQLSKVLISFASLKSLDLDFCGCDKITDKAFHHLNQGFISLPSLQTLSLDFTSCQNITAKAFIHLSQDTRSLPSLQSLTLVFRSSDEVCSQLSKALTSFTSLKRLRLKFHQWDEITEITDKAFHLLNQGLISLPSLQSLSLNFRSCRKITAEAFTHLSQDIRSLPSLQSLTLDLGLHNYVNEEFKTALRKYFEKDNNSLQNISIY